MGLDLRAKDHDTVSIGYIRFTWVRHGVVKAAYNESMLDLYEKSFHYPLEDFTEQETEYWNSHCNDDLDLLIWHSDCDGKLTYKECRRIYNVLKDLPVTMQNKEMQGLYEQIKEIIGYCAKTRRTLFFT